MKLAVVIPTKDEERQVASCIASTKLLAPSDVLVLDCGSADRTCALAEAAGARVVHQDWLGYSAQRNLAFDLTSADWLLFLDADERVSEDLSRDIAAFLAAPSAEAARFPRQNWFLGRHVTCRDPDWQLRLVRRGAGTWQGAIHERLAVAGAVASLPGALVHHQDGDLAAHFRRHAHYARLVAQDLHARGGRFHAGRLLSPWGAWPKFLLLKGGWRDGWRGLAYATAYLVYGLQKALFLLELERAAAPPPHQPPRQP